MPRLARRRSSCPTPGADGQGRIRSSVEPGLGIHPPSDDRFIADPGPAFEHPRFEDLPCHHHTRAMLSTEVKIQDDVLYSGVNRGLDRVLWSHRAEQFG